MKTHLEQELENIKIKIFEMADLAIESVVKAIESLKKSDTKLANDILEKDTLLDDLEISIDEECVRILVTKQPAAVDLRFVLAIMKINTELERIGDLSTNIAKETIRLDGKPPLKPLIDIPRMSVIGIQMIKDSFESISEEDVDKAKKVIEKDQEIDDLNSQLYRELFSIAAENPKTFSEVFGLLTVAKMLERIGDHATNIAERAIFYIEGIDVRHQG